MAAGGGGFIPVLHAATESRPDEVDTLVAAESVAAALEALTARVATGEFRPTGRPLSELATDTVRRDELRSERERLQRELERIRQELGE